MYVWVDALTNYLTGLGYPDDSGDMKRFWPADLHLIGKDIVRFHAVYWPAFLLSAGLPLPKRIFGHGFLLNKGQKESKSLGNVTDPMALADQFGVDQLRYFLMRELSFGQDGSYTSEAIVRTSNADLANSFGNLAQRSLSMIAKNMDGRVRAAPLAEADQGLLQQVRTACADALPREFGDLRFSQGIEEWLRAVFACNQYVDDQAPWALKKADPERMEAVLMTLFRAIRMLAIAIAPVVPEASAKLLAALGQEASAPTYAMLADEDWFDALVETGFTLDKPEPIFPRLDMPEPAET